MSDSGSLHVELDLGPSAKRRLIEGSVIEFGESSARVSVREVIGGGAKLGARFHRPSTGVSKQVAAYVVWHRPQPDGDTHLGLKFNALADLDLKEIQAACVWSVRHEGGRAHAGVRGDLVESVDFAPLSVELAAASTIELDVSHVRRINSVGAVRWIDFVHSLRPRVVHFVNCSLEFTSHAAMSTGMIGHGVVESVMAPYLCAKCGRSEVQLVDMAPLNTMDPLRPPTFTCACGGTLEFDDIPERYFSFLAD